MRRFIRFVRLPPSERRLLARTGLLLWGVMFGLWLLRYEKLKHLLLRKKRVMPARDLDSVRVGQIVRCVQVMSRYVPAATCLSKALVALKLLEEAGQPACLRIGVAKSELGKLEAHAWVESDGRVIIGGNHAEISRFTVLQPVEGI